MLAAGPAPDHLLPPAGMRYRVAGTDDAGWFHAGGEQTARLLSDALASVGGRLEDARDILDFGCGAGRVLRWLAALAPEACLYGAEIDAEALAWVAEHYPGLTPAPIRDGLPPLPFAAGAFDLVVAYSVFTHLDAHYQDAWLTELRHLVRPGGHLLLSISGPPMLAWTLRTSDHPNLDDLRGRAHRLADEGLLFWSGDGWEAHFPAYYHTTFHAHGYIRRHWGRWFEVLAIHDGTPDLPQEIVVLRRPT